VKVRLIVASVVLALWSTGIVARLYHLQVVDYELYSQRAEGQHHRRVVLQPPRGTIYDVRGRELALSVEVDSVWADPSQIEDPAATARALARTLGRDAAKLESSLASDREFVWIARQLDRPLADAVRQLALPGVGYLTESKRYYPMRELAAQILGFAGLDNRGLEGLEQAYNDVIAGEPAERKVLRDARRGTVLLPEISFGEAKPGRSLHLTIDAWIQHLLEEELAAAVKRTRARSATAVFLNPNTGAILAMASWPTFDPNHFTSSSRESWRNRAVMDAFEPGSTFKMVTAAAALEDNLVDPTDVFDCEHGSVVVQGVRIHDHKSFGDLTFREVIAKSSNVGAIKTGLLVGKQSLYEQIVDFGFGKPLGVDLPGESPGILRPVDKWPKRATAYISFGQNLSVTSLQMASAFAAVANGGTLLSPYVVAGIGENGQVIESHPRPRRLGNPITASTARTLERLLESVVIDGTGKKAAIPGYRVAGKTGTAQKASPDGGYAARKFVASFVGFAPARRPEIVGMVAIDEPVPSLGYHGGDVAAPVFSAVAGPALLYLGIPPDRETVDDEHWPGEMVASQEDSREPRTVESFAGSTATLVELAEDALPDFSGLTARQAVVRSAEIGLRATLHGQGMVDRQLPVPGTAVADVEGEVELWLAAEPGEKGR
jgi:cell division protein FtsI (penicillin-binding protein 3)